MPHSILHLVVPTGFKFRQAVCSYGFFMLAPNRWDAESSVLATIVHSRDGQLIGVEVSMSGPSEESKVKIKCDQSITQADRRVVKHQIARMLRLNEVFSDWHRLHPKARATGFGRLFRSATLFEDIVKTITSCNVAWPNTVRMNELLCAHYGGGGFPTPEKLARVKVDTLKHRCKVGYRAQRIIRLAREVVRGEIDLAWFERPERTSDELRDALLDIFGIGPYAANTLCQLLGQYDQLAIDSETYSHFRKVHGVETPDSHAGIRRLNKRIEKHYAHYDPYQFLAYWFELWGGYEEQNTFPLK